jgi:hypothetical protein
MPEHRGNLTDCATPIDGTRLADHDASLCNNETLVSGWLSSPLRRASPGALQLVLAHPTCWPTLR